MLGTTIVRGVNITSMSPAESVVEIDNPFDSV